MMPRDTSIATAQPDTRPMHSALQLTRAAIARWSGRTALTGGAKDVSRISPQARHLERARRELAAWMAAGGFTQTEMAAPARQRGAGPACAPADTEAARAARDAVERDLPVGGR